jgi:putative ABC transport system permease protein
MLQIWQDVRYALRVLSNTPTVTIVVVISLALGIGANTAVFSLMNALILRSLPVHNPGQLVAISTISPDGQDRRGPLSLSMFEAIGDHQQVFSSIFAWSGGGMSNFEANGAKYAASLNTVSGDYYSTLGIVPFLGRLITVEDVALKTGSSAQVAVLDYTCWQRRYNSDPAVIGKTIQVDGVTLTIIGVSPKNFAGLIIRRRPGRHGANWVFRKDRVPRAQESRAGCGRTVETRHYAGPGTSAIEDPLAWRAG